MKYMPTTYLDWKLAKQLDISTTKFALYDFGVRSFLIVYRQALTACPLLSVNKKKETDTETEKLIYYDCKRFRDWKNNSLINSW